MNESGGISLTQPTIGRLQLLIRNRAIPAADTFRLLEIWQAAAPATLERLDRGGVLPRLLMSYAPAFRAAGTIAEECAPLSDAERLELAGLPLLPPMNESRCEDPRDALPTDR